MRHKNTLVLGGVVIAFLAILIFTMTSIKGTNVKSETPLTETQETTEANKESESIAIIKKIDVDTGILTATDVDTRMEMVYSFTGGTTFRSRYGQEVRAKEIPLGEIVELTYDPASNKVISCIVTEKAWEYTNISNWTLDKEKQTISVGSKTFSYGSLFQVFNSSQMMDSNALSEKDLITVKGINGQAYSIIVTKGHGMFQLANYTDFVGGSIEIGYDVMTKVEEDQILTLREGDYRVTVKKGSLEAVKYVHINADEMTTLDLGDSKKSSGKMSKVKFHITPNGADLYINNAATEYGSEVTLEYGTYTIKASCTGYETYKESLTIDQETEEIFINLASSSLSKATESPSPTEKAQTETSEKTEATVSPGPSAAASASPTPTASAVTLDSDHTITVNGPSGVKLYINEEYKGTLPATITKVIGSNIKCTLKKDGQSDKTYTMHISDDGNDVTWHFSQWW